MKYQIAFLALTLIACGTETSTSSPPPSPAPPVVDSGAGGTPPEHLDAAVVVLAPPDAAPPDAAPDAQDGNVCSGLVEVLTLPEHDNDGAIACDTPMRCGDSCVTCQGFTDGSQGCCEKGEVFYHQETCSSGACDSDVLRGVCCKQGVVNFWQCKAIQ